MEVAQRLKQLSKDTLFYGLGAALQGSVAFLLFPLYTRLLTQEAFGTQDLVASAVTILIYFLMLGLDSGAARYYYDVSRPADKSAVLSTWLWFELLISIPVCIAVIGFAEPICAWIFGNRALAPFFRLGVASIPFFLTTKIATMTLRLTFQAKKFSLLAALGASAEILAAIILVAVLHLGLQGVFLTMLIASAIHMLVGLGFTYQHFRPVFSRTLLRAMLVFGVPLVPASLSLWILNYSNRYFLTRLGTLSDIALLSVAIRISAAVSLINAAFQYAWPPFAYSLLTDTRLAKQTYSRVLTFYMLITLSVSAGLAIFAREMLLILAPSAYQPSAQLVPWLCYSTIAWGATGIVGIGFEIAKKSYHFTIATILGAATTTVLNLLFIPRWGITAAAAATMIGNVVALCYGYSLGQHYFRVDYEGRKVLTTVTLATLTVAAALLVDWLCPTWGAEILLYKALLGLLFLSGLLVLRVVDPSSLSRRRWGSRNP